MSAMVEPRFVVLGTGRSGSGYLAALLNACGIACGHESWWNPDGERVSGLDGDSSWCALSGLEGYTGDVYVQHRHPLDVVSSMVATPDHGPWLDLRHKVLGELPDDRLAQAVAITARWATACDDLADNGHRVEDITVPWLRNTCADLGHPIDRGTAASAWCRVGTLTNSHGTTRRLRWSDLGAGDDVDLLRAHADKWRYR